jgi:cytochrome c biogenesis protein CcmG/thiol:disulfide interchange protein DsbE
MNNRIKLFIPAAFFAVMLGLLLFGLNEGRDPNLVPSALANRPLPAFERPDLFDPAKTVSSEQLQGGIFLVNFWGTWCPPCHAEHPYLIEISENNPDLTWVGVNVTADYPDEPERAREFLAERGNPYKISLIDGDRSLGIEFGVTGEPETFLVDSTGMIRYRHVGAIDNRVWADVFEPLIAQIQ